MIEKVKIIEVNKDHQPAKEVMVKQFQEEVCRYAAGGITLIEAIEEYCNRHEVEPEDVKKMISPNLMLMLHEEAMSLNLIEKQPTLPI